MVKDLVGSESIEVVEAREAARDLEAVLQSYVNIEQSVSEQARELVERQGLSRSEYSRIKRLAAEKQGIKVGDEGLDFLLDQLLEMLMHSANIEEVFAPDNELRKAMRSHIRKYGELEDRLDEEVRSKLKHVTEGSRTWEIEYQRMRDDIKRRRGL